MRVCTLVFALATIVAEMQGQVTKQPFGKTPDGTEVDIYTLKSAAIEVRVITYGGIVQSIKVPDKNGKIADVVLGFDSLDGYTAGPKPNPAFFGAIIGRYANRIAGAKFMIDGKTYSTPQNDGKNTLHSGPKGFDKAVWKAKRISRTGVRTYSRQPPGWRRWLSWNPDRGCSLHARRQRLEN